MATAVVTGAAGFLGSAFCVALRARGYAVRGIDIRRGPEVTHIGDVTAPADWPPLLEAVDLVVHTAAIVAEAGDVKRFWRVNVDGTRTVLEAAERAGVGRALHLSSIVVYGNDFPDEVTEDAPIRPSGAPYTDTKIASEHQALRIAARGLLPVTVVRPGDVYGPGSIPWTIRPVKLMRRRLFSLVDGGVGILSPTYVDDLVDGALAAATHEHGVGEVFNITGGVGVTARDFFAYYADALGMSMRSMPRPVLVALASVVERLFGIIGRDPPLAAAAVEYITHPGTYSVTKAANLLGWKPQVDLDEGMRRTLTWLRDAHLIP